MRASRVGLSLVVEASTQREGHVAQGVVADPPTRPGFPPYSLLSPEPFCQCVNQSAPCPPLLVSPFSIEWVVVHPWPSRCTQCASPTKEFGLGWIHTAAVYYHAPPPHPRWSSRPSREPASAAAFLQQPVVGHPSTSAKLR